MGMPGFNIIRVAVTALLLLNIIAYAAECPVIIAPGNYVLASNLSGAPHFLPHLYGNVCVYISSSDVVFDCNNYVINGESAPPGLPSFGVYVEELYNNVTIKNCNVKSYNYGIFSQTSNFVHIIGNKVDNCT
ncbi:MAG: hypothetical protein N3G76_00730, partial [Candidatus Micrarchaeota archaeon]|nr:hypothetical protein [Candidatus Micrarchaeota archaeon]